MKIKHSLLKFTSVVVFTIFIFSRVIHAQEIPDTSPLPTSNLPAAAPAVEHTESESDLIQDSYQAYTKKNYDLAIEKANQVIVLNPLSKHAYTLRGSIYGEEKEWDKASADYKQASAIDPSNSAVKFDMAELFFMQKKYDEARVGFAALAGDDTVGDFATYKVFLCDLIGGHEDAATKDLDALNQVGGNPSYYFGNAAWDLVHQRPADAEVWLKSASRIYANAPQKFVNYTHSLMELGYLPIHHLSSAQ